MFTDNPSSCNDVTFLSSLFPIFNCYEICVKMARGLLLWSGAWSLFGVDANCPNFVPLKMKKRKIKEKWNKERKIWANIYIHKKERKKAKKKWDEGRLYCRCQRDMQRLLWSKAWSKRGNKLCSPFANYQTYLKERRETTLPLVEQRGNLTSERKRGREKVEEGSRTGLQRHGERKDDWISKRGGVSPFQTWTAFIKLDGICAPYTTISDMLLIRLSNLAFWVLKTEQTWND